MEVLRTSFAEENNPNNPANKPDLLRSIKDVRAHKTFVNDESFSITKRYERYKNVPPEIRITTMCCLIAREIKGMKKSIFTVEMFISEIALVGKELFKKNFSYIGTLFKTYFIEDVIKVIHHSTPSWPARNGPENTELYPEFDLNISKSELNPGTNINFTSANFKPDPVEVQQPASIDDILNFIDPPKEEPKPKKKKTNHRSASNKARTDHGSAPNKDRTDHRSAQSQMFDKQNIFDPESAREFLNRRWLQACEFEQPSDFIHLLHV